MRVGMVSACYKPVLNGVTRMVELYCHHLSQAGHEVTVFTLGKPDPAGEDPWVIRSPAIPLLKTGYYFAPGYNKKAQTILRQMDILHCHQLFMSLELARRYSDRPIIYTDHSRYDLYMADYLHLPQNLADAIMRWLWPRMTQNCNVVISPTDKHRQLLYEFGVTRPVTVIPNGIDLELFYNPVDPCTKADMGIPEDELLLIFVGRLSEEKNVVGLLQQFAQAVGEAPLLHLLFVGTGTQAHKLREMARSLQIEKWVHFFGPVPYSKVGEILAAGDAFVSASDSEVHPLTIIEALAAGLPVLGIRSPGVDDIVISGRNGLLAENLADLSTVMLAFAAEQHNMVNMGMSARADSRQYDICQTVPQTINLYKQVLAGIST